ncbi:hypothetical protein [Agrobacterium vitis]|uniref:hypothetical protein n=1 Tax=Agrobacterium vitis TaxID=373 RepID=UPI003D2C9D11
MILPLFSNHPVFPALPGLLFAGLLALTPLGDACAATSDWATSDGGRMRVIVLPPAPDGTRQAGLQIEPNDGWFTYWREPGDSGIPPQSDRRAGGEGHALAAELSGAQAHGYRQRARCRL